MGGTSLLDKCDICGKEGRATDGFIVNTFGGYAGYGSAYDGEYIALHICPDCLDKILGQRPPQGKKADGA